MNKKGFAAIWIVLIAIIILSIGGVWYHKTTQSGDNVSAVNWQTYENRQLGFTAKYPSTWALNMQNGVVVFSLPNDTAGIDKGSQPSAIPVAIWISTSSYPNLVDYQKNIDSLANSNKGSMNYTDLGYEQIAGRNFFKDSWMHQAQGLDYVTTINGRLVEIQFRMDDTVLPFSQSASYKDFMTFLSSIQSSTSSTVQSSTLPTATPTVSYSCLPSSTKLNDVVDASIATYVNGQPTAIEKVTVRQKLKSLKATCSANSVLIDSSGKPIYFYHLTGCWGNPPYNYLDILQKQRDEINTLKQQYTVIEMTCNPSGIPIQ